MSQEGPALKVIDYATKNLFLSTATFRACDTRVMWVFTATRDTGRIFGGSTATPRLWNHFPHFQGPSSISKFLPIRCSLRGLCKYFIEFSGETGCGARWRLPLQIVSHAGLHENGETTRAFLRPSGQVSPWACDMQLPSDGVVNVQHMRKHCNVSRERCKRPVLRSRGLWRKHPIPFVFRGRTSSNLYLDKKS